MNLKKKQPDLSIIIPAFNEEGRVGKTLDELAVFLKTNSTMKSLEIEIIIVSADGNDKTHQAIKKHAKKLGSYRLLFPGKPVGKGRDVQYGMLRSSGRYSLFMDADAATPMIHIPELYDVACSGYDLVAATRNLKKHHARMPRRLLSIAGNSAFRILGGVWIEDSQCGFKLFSQKATQLCFKNLTISGWGFDMEVLTIAKVNRLRSKYVRINDWKHVPDGPFASSKILRSAFVTLWDLIRIFINRVGGKYRIK